MARLNTWARLAVVVTVIWILVGTCYFHVSTMNQRMAFAEQLEKSCIKGFDNLENDFPTIDYSKQRDSCATDMTRYLNSEPPASTVLETSLLGATILAIIFWGVVSLGIGITRWVLRGAHRVD